MQEKATGLKSSDAAESLVKASSWFLMQYLWPSAAFWQYCRMSISPVFNSNDSNKPSPAGV